jgi:hypothetical protein
VPFFQGKFKSLLVLKLPQTKTATCFTANKKDCCRPVWYAREMVHQACRDHLGIDGQYEAVMVYMRDYPEAYYLRASGWTAGCLLSMSRKSTGSRIGRDKVGRPSSHDTVLTPFPGCKLPFAREAARRLLALPAH